MLERALESEVPVGWVTADEGYGDDLDLRRGLEERGQAYVVAVSANHPLWHEGRQERAGMIVAALPTDP